MPVRFSQEYGFPFLWFYRFVQFPNESLLWEDIQNITEALERNEIDPQGVFLKGKDMYQ